MPGEVETTGCRASSHPGEKPSPHPGQLVFLKNGPLLPPHLLLAQQVSKGWTGLGWPLHAPRNTSSRQGRFEGLQGGPPCASDLAERGRSSQPHRRSCSQVCLGLRDGALEHWKRRLSKAMGIICREEAGRTEA